jgi:hypothetical protein
LPGVSQEFSEERHGRGAKGAKAKPLYKIHVTACVAKSLHPPVTENRNF